MLLLLLIFIGLASGNEPELLPNSTIEELRILNALEYKHKSVIFGHDANFTFTISNTTYATEVLKIDSFYYSVTPINAQSNEQRLPIANLSNETIHTHKLYMENLNVKENYFVCVFFLSGTKIIGSSRFCHVISPHGSCDLEFTDETFSNKHVLVLTSFVVGILLFTVVFSCARTYYYRPRTIEQLFETLPEHLVEDLQNLAPKAETRRKTQPVLDEGVRRASGIDTVYHNDDEGYKAYYENPLNTVEEESETS